MTLAEKKTREELEKLIDKAIKKLNVAKENDLCRYIPGEQGGYMHHFTLKKLKQREPAQLFELLKNFILEIEKPTPLNPKARAPRGSRKQPDLIHFTRMDLEKILDLARKMGDSHLIARFSSRKPLPIIKKELMSSIRANQIDQELWQAYVEALSYTNNSC